MNHRVYALSVKLNSGLYRRILRLNRFLGKTKWEKIFCRNCLTRTNSEILDRQVRPNKKTNGFRILLTGRCSRCNSTTSRWKKFGQPKRKKNPTKRKKNPTKVPAKSSKSAKLQNTPREHPHSDKCGSSMSFGTSPIVADGGLPGVIRSYGDDGVDLESTAAKIHNEVDGTPNTKWHTTVCGCGVEETAEYEYIDLGTIYGTPWPIQEDVSPEAMSKRINDVHEAVLKLEKSIGTDYLYQRPAIASSDRRSNTASYESRLTQAEIIAMYEAFERGDSVKKIAQMLHNKWGRKISKQSIYKRKAKWEKSGSADGKDKVIDGGTDLVPEAQVLAPLDQGQRTALTRFLTIAQAMEWLAVSRSQIYRLLDEGAIEGVKIGYSRKITEDSLVAYQESLRTVVSQPGGLQIGYSRKIKGAQ